MKGYTNMEEKIVKIVNAMAEYIRLKNITYKKLELNEINRDLFKNFIRHQVVTDCWRKENGKWVIKEAPFIDDWSEEDYGFLVECLRNTITTGGYVGGAFCEEMLKGFVSVEAEIFGGENKYADLSSIHVSEDMRGSGIGERLFTLAKEWAKGNGAQKLYISAHSAVESQGFYKKMGCVEAKEYNAHHVEMEPFDCQLECEI